MADSWIKMRVGLRRHPKVVHIVSALKADRCRVVGALHSVWAVFDEHSVDGILPGYSFEMMDEEIGWPGFCEAMSGIGWLKRDGDCGIVMREFSTHNGASAKRRAEDAKRKHESREAVRETSAEKQDKKRTRERVEKNSPSLRSGETARGARLAPDWVLPKPWGEWALKEQRTWDAAEVRRVALMFRNHWVAKSGRDAAKLDWEATWHNWVLKEGPRKVNGKVVDLKPWRAGGEPIELLERVARQLQLPPSGAGEFEGETHGQFRTRIVQAGGEAMLKPEVAA